jgi:hypothetical protein
LRKREVERCGAGKFIVEVGEDGGEVEMGGVYGGRAMPGNFV